MSPINTVDTVQNSDGRKTIQLFPRADLMDEFLITNLSNYLGRGGTDLHRFLQSPFKFGWKQSNVYLQHLVRTKGRNSLSKLE